MQGHKPQLYLAYICPPHQILLKMFTLQWEQEA